MTKDNKKVKSEWLKEKYNEDSIVKEAYDLAFKAHEGVKRESGQPYINHCLAVAKTVSDWGLDEITISAALLHDVVEDTDYSLNQIEDQFGEKISFLVNGLTKLRGLKYTGNEKQAENMRKLVLAISKDLRVVFIKLADRLHNMQTIGPMPEETKKIKAEETYDIYAPLAYRLGMQDLSGTLRDLAFPFLYPDEYKWLIKNVDEEYKERKEYAQKVKPILEEKLKKNGIDPLQVDARAKRYSSLYKKLLRYDMDIGKIYDLVALRVIVKDIEECYSVLGAIHKDWPPMPNRIKDYIAMPKPNGYRSLHTTVFCLDDKITEIQIRTQKMHEEAELGAAAHWAYQQSKHKKENRSPVADNQELTWVRQLRNWQKNFKDPNEFMQSLKGDFFKDRIFVITPENDVIDLPSGATPVDFAYRIHSEIGDQCAGAKVNSKIVSLDYELKSGDVVEIMTQKGKKPSDSWLDFVKTSTAISHIKSSLKEKRDALKRRITEPAVVFTITAKDRKGLMEDIGKVFSKSNINISSHNATSGPFPTITVNCSSMDEDKIEKIMVKLKAIDEVQEVEYNFKR